MAFRHSSSRLCLNRSSGLYRSGRASSPILIDDASSEEGYFEHAVIPSLTHEEFEGLDHSARRKQFGSMRQALLKLNAFSKAYPRLEMTLFQLQPLNNRLSMDELDHAARRLAYS